MKYATLILTISMLAIVGCEKNPDPTKHETTFVNGTVNVFGTNAPLQGATVKLINRETGRDTVAKVVTDENGHFSYSWKGPISFGLCSYVFKDLYFTEQGSYSPDNPDMCHQWGVQNSVVLTAKPYAWLKLQLVNTSGATGISINRPTGSDEGCNLGYVSDTIVHFLVWGNYHGTIGVFIKNGSTILPSPFAFYAPDHDTTFYKIEY